MQNILIIGGSSSVGTAIINALIKEQKNIVVTYNNTPINIKNELLHQLILDLNNKLSIDRLISYIKDTNFTIDVAIFLPSILLGKSLDQYNDDNLEEVMSVNFTAQIKLLKEMLPYLDKEAQTIMVSSISGQRGSFDPIYAASKAAILGFVKSMSSSIRINAIAPSLIENSNMYNNMSTDIQEKHRNATLSKQLLKMDDLASIITDMIKPHWRHLNGACIDINGGQYVR